MHRVTHGLARDKSVAHGGTRNAANKDTVWGFIRLRRQFGRGEQRPGQRQQRCSGSGAQPSGVSNTVAASAAHDGGGNNGNNATTATETETATPTATAITATEMETAHGNGQANRVWTQKK